MTDEGEAMTGIRPERPIRRRLLSGRRRSYVVAAPYAIVPLLVLVCYGYSAWQRSHPDPGKPPFAVGDCLAIDSDAGDFKGMLPLDDKWTKLAKCTDATANYLIVRRITGLDASTLMECPDDQKTLGWGIGGSKWTYCMVPQPESATP